MKLFASNPKKNINIQNLTMIGKETVISGGIAASGDIRIDGTVNGDVATEYRLVVGEKGIVLGNISAKSCEISGEVRGDVKILETLSLTKNSRVLGDIFANKLSVEVEAFIKGKCHIGEV